MDDGVGVGSWKDTVQKVGDQIAIDRQFINSCPLASYLMSIMVVIVY